MDRLNPQWAQVLNEHLRSQQFDEPLWKAFPVYSLATNLEAALTLLSSLEKCYEPEAIKLRCLFLKNDLSVSERLANELFEEAGNAFEKHLRSWSDDDLRKFAGMGDDTDIGVKLSFLLKPSGSFTPQEQQSMGELLAAVWTWARNNRLEHYSYVHIGCLALIEGHKVSVGSIRKKNAEHAIKFMRPPSLLAVSAELIRSRSPQLAWAQALLQLSVYATKGLNEAIPKPPTGFPLYRGGVSYEAAKSKEKACNAYVALVETRVVQLIETSYLAAMKGLHRQIKEQAVALAREYAEAVERSYSREKKPVPARYGHHYERDLEWTVKRVFKAKNWNDVAVIRHKNDTVKKAVTKIAKRLYLPGKSVSFGKAGRKKRPDG